MRMADTAPGEVAEADSGRLGTIIDPATGKLKVVWALIIVLSYSRHCSVWLTHSQKLENMIAALEAAWAFFGGVPRYLAIDNFPAAAARLEDALTEASEPLAMEYVEASADDSLIRSGSLFIHPLFDQHGTVVPWQYPYSELDAPFLIGEHEFLMGAPRWVGSYSAVTEGIVIWIPVALIDLVVDRIPQVRVGCTNW